jgi:hypothetical protein
MKKRIVLLFFTYVIAVVVQTGLALPPDTRWHDNYGEVQITIGERSHANGSLYDSVKVKFVNMTDSILDIKALLGQTSAGGADLGYPAIAPFQLKPHESFVRDTGVLHGFDPQLREVQWRRSTM